MRLSSSPPLPVPLPARPAPCPARGSPRPARSAKPGAWPRQHPARRWPPRLFRGARSSAGARERPRSATPGTRSCPGGRGDMTTFIHDGARPAGRTARDAVSASVAPAGQTASMALVPGRSIGCGSSTSWISLAPRAGVAVKSRIHAAPDGASCLAARRALVKSSRIWRDNGGPHDAGHRRDHCAAGCTQDLALPAPRSTAHIPSRAADRSVECRPPRRYRSPEDTRDDGCGDLPAGGRRPVPSRNVSVRPSVAARYPPYLARSDALIYQTRSSARAVVLVPPDGVSG